MRIIDRKPLAGACLAVLISLSPISAEARASTTPIDEVTSLDPGRFVWQPQRGRQGPVEVVVSLPLQMAYVYRGGALIGVSSVSTGRPGYDTPAGRFQVLQKRRFHRSNLYDDAPMPFMQRLTWDGVALHGGSNPGYPDSHGCIRLPQAFARHLFSVTDLGATVHVTHAMPITSGEALAMARADSEYTGMGGPDEGVD